LGLAACLMAGGLFASNMGFKLNYALTGPAAGVSATGTQTMSLPYNQQVGIDDAQDLFFDLPAQRVSVARWVKSNNGTQAYTGGGASVNFPIVPGDGYFATVSANTSYVIVGSHNPSLSIQFDAPGSNGSATGTTLWSYPYHSVSTTAEQLRNEINNFVGDPNRAVVARFLRSNNGVQSYTGGGASVNFALIPGEAYFVTVSANTAFVPAHF
jgi:hypothetical protein